MTEKRFTIKEIDNFNYGIKVTDVIMDEGIELPQSTVCDLLNQLSDENEQLKSFKSKVFKLIDDSIKIYEDTTTNDEFLQIQLDTKLQTLYNLRKELQE